MSKHHKLSQICFYIGTLMALTVLDWFFYVRRNPDGRFVAAFSKGGVLYGAYLTVMVLCFMSAAYFGWKARPKHTGRGSNWARTRRG